MGREYAFTIPAHLVVVDALIPFDLSVTASGYSFGVIDTAVMWINEYANSRSQKSH